MIILTFVLIDLILLRLRWHRENGLMNKIKRRWFPKKPMCEGGSRGFVTVGIAEVKPAIIFYIVGTGVSSAILIIEIILHKLVLMMEKEKIKQKLEWRKTVFFEKPKRQKFPSYC